MKCLKYDRYLKIIIKLDFSEVIYSNYVIMTKKLVFSVVKYFKPSIIFS